MALEHLPAALDINQTMRAMAFPAYRSACGHWQEGDTLATTVANLPPVLGTCPKCYLLANPGATSLVLDLMEA